MLLRFENVCFNVKCVALAKQQLIREVARVLTRGWFLFVEFVFTLGEEMKDFRRPRTGEEFYESFEGAPLFTAVLTYLSFLILNILGRLQDFLRFIHVLENHSVAEVPHTKSFVPLYSSYEAFYTRNLYRRAQDCWSRPVCSAPGSEIVVMDRKSPDYGWTLKWVEISYHDYYFYTHAVLVNLKAFVFQHVFYVKKCNQTVIYPKS